MATYLLLRDNKQTGPYTFDEIKAKGFKAYDLVWIEGKSAAWRYPGEIEEFKLLAPPVEEQPYDRFFKKPAQPPTSVISSIIQNHIAEAQSHPADKVIREINANENNRAAIYVTRPAAQKTAVVQEQNEVEKIKSQEHPKKGPEVTPHFSSVVNSAQQVPFFADEVYQEKAIAQPNINAVRTAQAYSERNQNRKYIYSLLAGVVLLGAGIAIGLFISKSSFSFSAKNNLPASEVTSSPAQQKANKDENVITAIPVSSTVIEQKLGDVKKDNITTTFANPQDEKKMAASNTNAEKKKTIAPVKEKTDVVKPSPSSSVVAKADSDNSTSPYSPIQRRESTHRADAANDKENISNPSHLTGVSLINLVSVTTNKYNVGTFGGISDLQLTVSNQTGHALDLVVVEVQYVQANKKIFKTENIYFRNITTGSALMQEAPTSSRGIKVQYRVTIINTKDQGLSYSAL